MNYYNEFDPSAIAWLRELMAAGAIPDGHIDTRSIVDVQPEDLDGFDQCHFFCGVAGWLYALQLSGYQNVKGLWTGSCPCQPFSAAGKRKGTADARHLWPEMFRLVKACRPQYVLGEQVEAAIRLGWLDGVFGDLEGEGYTCGAAVLGAHSVGAPHIRQRLYWGAARLADAENERLVGRNVGIETDPERAALGRRPQPDEGRWRDGAANGGGAMLGLADANMSRRDERTPVREQSVHCEDSRAIPSGLEHTPSDRRDERRPEPSGRGTELRCGEGDGLAEPHGEQWDGRRGAGPRGRGESPDLCGRGDPNDPRPQGHGAVVGERAGELSPWAASTVIPCADGKTRRISVEPALFPLAHGVPGRVGLLRGAGNAIVPQVAALFITSFMESLEC